MNHNDLMIISCDWSVKDNDNESNSQPRWTVLSYITGCDWSVKDNESNSQQSKDALVRWFGCDWSVQDNDDLSFASDLGRRL